MSEENPEVKTSIEPEGEVNNALPAGEPPGPTFDLSVYVEPQGILCQFQCEGHSEEWKVPKTVVHRAHKAMTIDHVFDLLGAGPIVGYYLQEAATNEPEFLMVPRAVNALTDRVTKALRQVQKAHEKSAKAEVSTTGLEHARTGEEDRGAGC
jgi:hypothetical protein